MGLSKDIINIVISKYEKKRLNQNYYDKYDISDTYYHRYGTNLRYECGFSLINNRNLISKNYRKKIVCFVTETITKYCVPKNY